ncbi:MAG TPA: glycoside hydrolase family 30 beta sandwich domain-containing protein [Terracidiphilus sp.]|jgi:glucosylceramidase|nr:glycoside hydrolase family 30 beta sandwich domain-containing protein [Terracidiphilus sp.]
MVARSRRNFLKSATAAAAVLTIAPPRTWAQPSASSVRVWSTFRDRRHAAAEPLMWKPAGQIAASAIVLDPSATRQQILGFGAAMTDAACYVLSQMSQSERDAVLHDIFSPDEMAMNVCRTSIGASDYSRTLYSYDESETPDPELKKFSIEYDKQYILPVLRESRKHNPELFLFSSPWSPPGWMKPDHTMLGGAMRGSSFDPYARYFIKFLEGYKAEGVSIDAVTVQNETDAEQGGRMPACTWAQEIEMEFAARYLAPAIRKAGLDTKVWLLDHNYSLWGRAIDELSDPAVYDAVDGIAWHGYVGEPTAMTRVHDAFPAKHAYWTEGGPDISQPDYQTDFTQWAQQFNGILNNWARSITAWNLALDEKGKPNIGPFSCGGTITIENGTVRDASHKVTRSGQYWAFAHFSRHVRRGARVFATNGVAPDPQQAAVSHCGFVNPDGKQVLVVANRGGEQRVQFVLGGHALELDLPADSVHTLEWA